MKSILLSHLTSITEWRNFVESILEGLSAEVSVVDNTGEIVFANQTYKEFAKRYGADFSLVSEGCNYLAVCDSAIGKYSDYAHAFAQGLRNVLQGGQPSFELEYPCNLTDSQQWFVARVSLLTIEGCRYAIIEHENISKLKVAELSLQKFKNTLDQTLDCVFIFEPIELYFTYVNDSAVKQLGYSQSELLSMHPWDINPDLSEAQFRQLITRLISGDEFSLCFETTHQQKDGRHILVEIILQYLLVEGETSHFIAIVRDVTERNNSQQDLKLLSNVASQTTNSVVITDVAGKVTWVNDGFCRMTGYALEEVVGKKPGLLLHGPETHPSTVAEMRAALNDYKEFNVDIINYRKDGTPYWIRIHCNPIRNENAEIEGFIAIQSDIDKEKKQEKLLLDRALRIAEQRNVYAKLSNSESILNCSFDDQLATIVTNLGVLLQPDAISIWLFRENNSELERKFLYEINTFSSIRAAVLNVEDIPSYVAALNEENQIDATDVEIDPRIKELPFNHFVSYQTCSSFHNGIRLSGRLIGVLCIEHYAQKREWHSDEKTFLSAISSLCAQYFANNERQKAQLELRNTIAIQTAMLNTIVDGIVLTDQDGIIKMTNPSLERIFDYSDEELLGKNIKMLMSEAYAESHSSYMVAYKEQSSDFNIMGNTRNLTAKRRNGVVFPVEIAVQKTGYDDEVLYIASINDISELKAQQEKIETLAYYDSLTGLPNRRFLEDRVDEINANGTVRSHGNALIFIDIDDFKFINDALGHTSGDLLLVEAGKRIKSCLSLDTDMVVRLGGDEFCVVLFRLEGDEQAINLKAEQVSMRIANEIRKPFLIEYNHLTVSASIGVSAEYLTTIDLHIRMKRADMAMYEAKKAGKNRVCLFDTKMETELLWRLKILADLGHAVEQEAITIHYQPIVDDSGCIVKLEALARWQHPTEGWISPDLFIPIAEASQLIMPLGEHVLCTVLKDIENWSKIAPNLKWNVAVNISQFQLAHPHFQSQIEQILLGCDFAFGRLIFEVTESALANDIDISINKMQALISQGISFSLDDFGTGYSSLDYLKRLPIREIKIDKSFVNTIPKDHKDVAIIKSVCSLAREMGLKVTAEGVETAKQNQFLKDLKCDFYQGYYFSKPLPASDIEQLLWSVTLPILKV